MNTSITSEFEYAQSLLMMSQNFDNINISGISSIRGTDCEIKELLDTSIFDGITSPTFYIDGAIEDDDKNFFDSEGLTIIT
tara:strand:- start:676 stop:918 length:243 start_codon:yes stop_codon:yes gene_type:complete